MKGWARSWTFATALAGLAMASNALAASAPTPTATVSPTSGYPGARLVATYSFTSKSSCSEYHAQVVWSFGSTNNWATGAAPAGTGGNCTSATPSAAPPSGATPGSYMVCGTDTSVSSTPACTTYTIKLPPPPSPPPSSSPQPTPAAAPSTSGSPSPSPTPPSPPGAFTSTTSPSPSPGSAPSGGTGGDGSKDFQPVGRTAGIPAWPWLVLLVLLVLVTAAWRSRSWLMGVFENVEVLGRSGADLETELLHHQASPRSTATTGGETEVDGQGSTRAETYPQPSGSSDPENMPGASAISAADASAQVEPGAASTDPDANQEPEALDEDA